MSEEQLTVESLAKVMADFIGHGMTEKCERHAQAIMPLIATIERDTAKKIRLKLQIAKDAKKKHKLSNQCEETTIGRCTACHFWSGTISAYSELIGEPGVID